MKGILKLVALLRTGFIVPSEIVLVIVSNTVIVAVAVFIFPFTSVAVSVTMTGAPTLLQLNDVCDEDKLATPQASFVPLFNCRADTVAVPAAFKYTVLF